MTDPARRRLLGAAGASMALGWLGPLVRAEELMPQPNQARVVIVGGGFAGAFAAKTLRQANPEIEVVLVERNRTYTALPGSNWVLGGHRRLGENRLAYDRLEIRHGVKIIYGEALAVDADQKHVRLDAGTISFDAAIVAPGISFATEAIEGYDARETPTLFPHAWAFGEEVAALKRRIEEMKSGGVVVVTLPAVPFRCPQAAYERISQIAFFLKQGKPRSKIIVLDANQGIAGLPDLFQSGWKRDYKDIVEYHPEQPVVRIDTGKSTVVTTGGAVRGDVVNFIPPQAAGTIAHRSGLVGEDKRWCPIDYGSHESTLVPGIHVLGDACLTYDMQKSAAAAYAQANACALAIAAQLSRHKRAQPNVFSNVIYSLINDREGASSVAMYRGEGRRLAPMDKGGGDAAEWTALEAVHGRAVLGTLLSQMAS